MVISFQEGHEERSAAPDAGSDDLREESFEDEVPFEDYASDNAGDQDDNEVDEIVLNWLNWLLKPIQQ